MLARSGGIDHPYLKKGTSTKKAIVPARNTATIKP
jgi:F-type H+-transporting ATPase subunit gamma